jgi:glycosyltransferase involved in cell wall biosynthesis
MRLLFFNRSAAPLGGGMNRLVTDTARRLRDAGHEVALVHSRNGGQFDGTGYIYDDLDYRMLPRDANALRLEAILEDFSPEVIQLHGVGNTLLDGWLSSRVPTVRFVHNHAFYCSGQRLTLERPHEPCQRAHGRGCCAMHVFRGCGSWNPALNILRYRSVNRSLRALSSVHGLQVLSSSLRRQLVANGLSENRVMQLPPYAPPPTAPVLESVSSHRSILHVGGLLGHKGVWMVVRMLRELPPDVQLIFAGGGGEISMLQSHVKRRGLGNRVRIVGEPTPEQWSLLYREATLVVMPVLWNEPLGLDGLSAMAHGKPVVAFETEGIRDWLSDGETGVCIEFGHRRRFRAAVCDLLNDRERLLMLGRRSRQIWEQKFQPEQHLAALVASYEKVKTEAVL